MAGTGIDADVEALLVARDPWHLIEKLATAAGLAVAFACENRFEDASEEGRRRLVWLLRRAGDQGARETLSRLLPRTTMDQASQILRALNELGVKVPGNQISRLLAEGSEAAVVAAGCSGDVSFSVALVDRLTAPGIGRHAAFAIAMLGEKRLAGRIAAQIPGASALDVAGFTVALELLDEPSVVPTLRQCLDRPDVEGKWDIHHALCRLTGREPVVPFAAGLDLGDSLATAWRTFDLDGPARPRVASLALQGGARVANFQLIDGQGAVRIDYLPPSPGSSWPRWSLALYAGARPVYEMGSYCPTCETTLTMVGLPVERAAAQVDGIRRILADVERLDAPLLDALFPLLTTLQTGHYLAALIDLDLERVNAGPESWLTRRQEPRRDADGEVAPSQIEWPGTTHFQARMPSRGEPVTYALVMPMADLSALNPETLEKHADAITSGSHPTALLLTWLEAKDVRGEYPERFLVSVVLDGHHKLAAYARLRRPARCLVLCRLEDSWAPGDRSAPLLAALRGLDQRLA